MNKKNNLNIIIEFLFQPFFSFLFIFFFFTIFIQTGLAQTGYGLSITEFMTGNDGILADRDGDYSDWIEIHNGGDADTSLNGWHLTDVSTSLTKWTFPDVMIPAGGYLVVFASGKDRRVSGSELHANFKLNAEGGYLALAEPSGQIPVSEYSPSYPALKTNVSFGLYLDTAAGTAEYQFFTQPTPGSANKPGVIGFVSDTHFSIDRGFYEEPFEVVISNETPEAVIRYTTDGSEPAEENSEIYNGPIQINTTTPLRAAAFKTGYQPSNVDTHTYIFLNDVIRQTQPDGYPSRWGNNVSADYEVDPDVVNDPRYQDTIKDDLRSIPTLSIVTHPDNLFGSRNGIYVHPESKGEQWERPASTEWILPDGSTGFQIDNGLRIQGGYSRLPEHRKHSFRLLFKTIYGPAKLRYPLFEDSPVEKFDTLTLRGSYNYSWHSHEGGFDSTIGKAEYMRDEFSRRTQLATGQPASHGTFVHLYLNGLYWGLYNVCERPDDAFSADYFGGEKEEWDVVTGGTRNNNNVQVKAGTIDAYEAMMDLADAGGLQDNEKYQAILQYVDADALIDYMLTIFYTGNRDAPTVIGGGGTPWNFYSSRWRKPGEGYKFYAWDSEWTLEEPDRNVVTFHNGRDNPARVFNRLKPNADFKILVADHIQRHFFNGGCMTPQASIERYSEIAQFIDRAIVGESARWGDTKSSRPKTRDDDWIVERDRILNDYLPVRTENVLQQLRESDWFPKVSAPEFNQLGGAIDPGFELTMTSERLTESEYQVIPLVDIDREWKYEQSGTDLGTAWRNPAYDDSVWPSGQALFYVENSDLSVSKITPLTLGPATFHFRTKFFVSNEIDLKNAMLELRPVVDDGAVVYLNGVEIYRIGISDGDVNFNTFANRTVGNADYEGPFIVPGSSLKQGENVLAVEVHQINATSSDIVFGLALSALQELTGENPDRVPIYYTTDGSDPRLPDGAINNERARLYSGPVALSENVTIRARALSGDTWSALSEAVFYTTNAISDIAILQDNLKLTELMYDPPAGSDYEFLEFHNVHPSLTLDLSGLTFTNGIEYVFPEGTQIPPDGYLLLTPLSSTIKTDFLSHYGLDNWVSSIGPYSGKLSNSGEQIILANADGDTVILSFEFSDGRGWPLPADGAGHSMTPTNLAMAGQSFGSLDFSGNWQSSAVMGGSPGREEPIVAASVILNEFLADSEYADPAYPEVNSNDWIELFNPSQSTIHLSDWYLSDDKGNLKKWEIPPIEIAPNAYVSFDEITGFNQPQSDTGFGLDRSGEQVILSYLPGVAGVDRVVDSVRYAGQESGLSLGRGTNGDPYWLPMNPTRGRVNTKTIGHVVVDEFMYHPSDDDLEDSVNLEYIELYNPTSQSIDLWNQSGFWRLSGGVDYVFPAETPIPAGGRLLLVGFDVNDRSVLSQFTKAYNLTDADLPILGPYSGKLSNKGERISLEKPLSPDDEGHEAGWAIVDEIIYFHQTPWPAEADGTGMALHRISSNRSGNDPANWSPNVPTPGQRNETPVDLWMVY